MFLLRGLLIHFLEWALDKLKGYKFFYHCLHEGCNFKGASNDQDTIMKLSIQHDKMHKEKDNAGV